MADAATAQAPQAESPQPAPIVASFEGLDAAMAHARQVADGQPAASPAETSGAPEGEPVTPATAQPQSVQPASDDAPEDGEEGQSADPNQPARPSRMGRLREQLTQAEQRARDAETKFQERLGADLKVRQKYASLLGTPEEKANLEAILANGSSPDSQVRDARTRLAQIRQANEELAPLWKTAQEDVFTHFIQGLEGLRTLDGMDEAAHQSLYKAPSGVDALRLMHGIGEKAADERYKGEVASLRAQVSDLKTKLAARGSQPANGGGLASGGSTQLAGLLGADGLPTEEAIARARAGGLRSLGVPAAA